MKDGGVLLSVHCDSSDEVSRAKEILKATRAEDISSSGEKSVSTHGVETNKSDADRRRIGVSSTNPTRTGVNRDREIV